MGHSHASPCSRTLPALSKQQGPRGMLHIPAGMMCVAAAMLCRIWWQPPVAIFGLDVFLHTLFKLKDTPKVGPCRACAACTGHHASCERLVASCLPASMPSSRHVLATVLQNCI